MHSFYALMIYLKGLMGYVIVSFLIWINVTMSKWAQYTNDLKGLLVCKFCLCSLIVLLSFASNNAVSQELEEAGSLNKTDIKAGLVVFPPHIQQSADNRCFGSAVDTLRENFPPERYNLSIYCATPARVYSDFEKVKIDLTINIKTTKSLPKDAYFSDQPVEVLDIMLYSRKGTQPSTISAIRRFSYHGIRNTLMLDGREIIDQANSKEAIVTFLRGGTEGLISYRKPFDFYLADILEHNKSFGNQTDYTVEKLVSVSTYFVVNRQSPYAERLIAELKEQ